jgi:hypothetical protein
VSERPAIDVAVILRKVRTASPWQAWRWELDDVVANEPAFGAAPRLLHRDDEGERWLHPGLKVELFRDEAEGYYLNLTTPAPAWFVMWRMDEEGDGDAEPIARPVLVTLSYNEGARWLDAQETVEQVPAGPEVIEWMRAFAEEHYVPEPKKRKRPESFRRLEDRFGQPASVTTGKKYGGGDGHE